MAPHFPHTHWHMVNRTVTSLSDHLWPYIKVMQMHVVFNIFTRVYLPLNPGNVMGTAKLVMTHNRQTKVSFWIKKCAGTRSWNGTSNLLLQQNNNPSRMAQRWFCTQWHLSYFSQVTQIFCSQICRRKPWGGNNRIKLFRSICDMYMYLQVLMQRYCLELALLQTTTVYFKYTALASVWMCDPQLN